MRRIAPSLSLLALTALGLSQSVDPKLYQELAWRCIGPHRGGRTVGGVGVAGQPNVFYIGVNNGGVWKTTDFGRTWNPIFDQQPTGSIGDVAVAPSDPNIVYVGSGEGIQRPDLSVGNGIYRSADAGKTWTHLGLEDAQQIAGIAVDPRNANRVFVAALGHPYGANKTRGLYRSEDGGKTWSQILYINNQTGCFQVLLDPKNPDTLYADMWQGQQGPWENAYLGGPASGLYKSTDGGSHWKLLSKGLPGAKEGLSRIGLGIAPSNPQVLYATVQSQEKAGIYKTVDGGETWNLASADGRLWGRGDDFAEIKVDPKNPDIVYDANVCTYKSVDGGKSWVAWKGAPGGDDYHRLWINPDVPQVILLTSDQGAIVTVNGGETWSSWYNQPTAQLYHVADDNSFPYRLYSGQQESGSVGISSRGADGAITFRDWHPVAAEEYGYVAPDPLDPNIVYGGKLTKFDWRTMQGQSVRPPGSYRTLRTAPLIFSPADPHTLFYAGNVLFRTRNGGSSWETISPDLSREHPEPPASLGSYRTAEMEKMPRRGVIYSIGPSRFDVDLIWAGTDDGLIHVTRDGGKHWRDVTPPEVTSWSKVSQIDAGHFDKDTCYIAVNRIRCDDMRPHIYRTHDGGATWREIVRGLLVDAPVNTVREDPQCRGLLYAGTETSVWFSADDGDTWNPLRMNMPATSIRDLIVKDDDLAVGTHGRSFWILDDITPLRQLAAAAGSAAYLFAPERATRVRWNINTDTPVPPDEPAGKNPPEGAILNYLLPSGANLASLEILDGKGNLVRKYSSADKPQGIDPNTLQIPTYWIRPPQILSKVPGMHRFIWDLHWGPEPAPQGIPMNAIYRDTAAEPKGPWALPGRYTVRLTVDGKSSEQPLELRMDPRVPATPAQIAEQFAIASGSWNGALRANRIQSEIASVREQIKAARVNAPASESDRLAKIDETLADLQGQSPSGRRSRFGGGLADEFGQVMGEAESADVAPTETTRIAYRELVKRLAALEQAWTQLKKSSLQGFSVKEVPEAAPRLSTDSNEAEP